MKLSHANITSSHHQKEEKFPSFRKKTYISCNATEFKVSSGDCNLYPPSAALKSCLFSPIHASAKKWQLALNTLTLAASKALWFLWVRKQWIRKWYPPSAWHICFCRILPYFKLFLYQVELSFSLHSLCKSYHTICCHPLYFFQIYYITFEMSRICFKVQIHMGAKYPNSPFSQRKLADKTGQLIGWEGLTKIEIYLHFRASHVDKTWDLGKLTFLFCATGQEG